MRFGLDVTTCFLIQFIVYGYLESLFSAYTKNGFDQNS